MKAIEIVVTLAEKINAIVIVKYPTRTGLEYRVWKQGYGVLFRAFIPESDYPVELDLFSEGDRTCQNAKELEDEINQYINTMGS